MIDVSIRRSGDENVGCGILKVGLCVYIRIIVNRSIDEKAKL